MLFAMSPSASVVVLTCLVFVVLVVEAAVVPHPPVTKIVGGHEIEISDAPWQILLLIGRMPKCGGSILNDRWVLTAAHCTDGYPSSLLRIQIGSNLINQGEKLYEVFEVIEHRGYGGINDAHDIALIKTMTPMDLSAPVRAVRLPGLGEKRPEPGTKLKVTGWGMTEDDPYSETLRSVDVELMDFKECAAFAASKEESTICAGLPGKDSCNGDSGGPLVMGDLLVGVVSYGPNATCGDKAGFYMDVAYYREWIDLYMNEECP